MVGQGVVIGCAFSCIEFVSVRLVMTAVKSWKSDCIVVSFYCDFHLFLTFPNYF